MCSESINKPAGVILDQSLQNVGPLSSLRILHEAFMTSSHSDQMSMPVPIYMLNTNEAYLLCEIKIEIEVIVFCFHTLMDHPTHSIGYTPPCPFRVHDINALPKIMYTSTA